MTDDSREPSLADLARAQAARRAEAEARQKQIAEENKLTIARRREKWTAIVVSARDFVAAANADLADTGVRINMEEAEYKPDSFKFGVVNISLSRDGVPSKSEFIEFRCSTVGFIDYDFKVAGKNKETHQIYLDDVEGGEANREIRKFLTEVFNA